MCNAAYVSIAVMSVAACSVVSLPVEAADTKDYSSYLALQTSDPSRNESSFIRANWGPNLEAAKEGGKYLLPEGMTMYSSTGEYSFLGDALAIAGTFIGGNSGGTWNRFRELRMLPGGKYKHNSNNHLEAQEFVILGTEEKPSLFDYFIHTDKYVCYEGKFLGDESAVAILDRGSKTECDRAAAMSTYNYVNVDFSKYLGKLILGVGTYARLYFENPDSEATRIAHTYPGTIELKKDSILGALLKSEVRTNIVGGLVFNPGSELNLFTHGTKGHFTVFTVTNRFSASGNFRVGFSYDRSPAYEFDYDTIGRNGHIPLVHLTGPAAETDADFSESTITNLYIKNRIGNLPSNVRLGLFNNGDGTKDVSVKWDPVVLMNKVNASNGSSSPLAFTDDSCWSTGTVPDEDFSGNVLVEASSLGLGCNATIVRTNMVLTVRPKAAVYNHAWTFSVKELHLVGGSTFFTYAGAPNPAIHGKIVVWPGESPVSFKGWADKCYRIYSEISGDGVISVCNHNPTSVSMELYGTNVNYSGAFVVDSREDSWVPASGTDECTTLFLNDGRNLGGVYAGDDSWKALTVKGNSKIAVRSDVMLDEPTRGIYVENAARFVVPEDKTFVVMQNITFAGELVKTGAGRLTLGGAALFVDGNPDTAPVEGLNKLTVSEGVLKVASTNALDGVAAKFAAGTTLELGAFPKADGMADWGIVNTKWHTPFVSVGGKVRVEFIDDGTECGDNVQVAVCTVQSSAVDSLPFAFGRLRSGYYTKVTTRDNGDGTVTVIAGFQRMGTRVIVR